MTEEIEMVYERLSFCFETRKFADLRILLLDMEPADIAIFMENNLNEKEQVMFFRLLPKELASDVFVDTDTDTQLTMTKARANCEGERFKTAFPEGMGVRGYAQTGADEDGTLVFADTKTIFNFLPEHIIAWDEDFSLHLAQCKYEGWVMQAMVNNAKSIEELEAIVLD